MIASLITSQTRIKLLIKFFLNSNTRAHLRGLESEFGESTNGIRVELNRMERADLLRSIKEGNKKVFFANRQHPLYNELHNIIIKETGIDKVVEKVIHRIGDLRCVYLTGDLAHGKDSKVIELVMVGSGIDKAYLSRKVKQAEEITGREVKYKIITVDEAEQCLQGMNAEDLLPIWTIENGKS